MITLVVLYCLVSDPTSCVEDRPYIPEPLTMTSCPIAGMQLAAEYVTTHPKYVQTKIKCEYGSRAREST